MFGNGAKFVGSPIGSVNAAAGLTNNVQQQQNQQQHQSTTRNLWPTATTAFQGGDFTVPIADSSLLATHPATSQPSYLSSFPLELIKNWNSSVLGLSQVSNSSIFVQTQSADIVNNTFTQTITSTSSPTQVRRNDTIENWESSGSLVEPLHITLPITTASIKAENPSDGSSSSSFSSCTRADKKRQFLSATKCSNKNLILSQPHHQHASNNSTICEITKVEPLTPTVVAGCSRTLPLTWHHGFQQLDATSLGNQAKLDNYAHHNPADLSTAQLLQIKTEPCQVSEVTTSNNFITTTSLSASPALIKIEQKSPTTSSSVTTVTTVPVTSSTANMELQTSNNVVQNNGATTTIPIGIAVGRQRMQETTSMTTTVPQIQSKDFNRFSMGLDLGCAPNISQNMFFTGATIPFTDVVHQNHQNIAMTQSRAPTTLLQYPTTMPMEIPAMPPPVGFQLVRDPVTGQLLFFPTTGLSTIESIPQTLVWPSYHQTAAAPNMSQQPQILLPQLQQSLQPPPLALLGSEYLSANCASTTLHQSHMQHTSTHSTRLVSLNASESNKQRQQQQSKCANVTMPAPTQTYVKIEDSHHQQPLILESHHDKSYPTVSVASAFQSNDIAAQVFYQHPGLIQIATQPQPAMAHQANIINPVDYRTQKSSPPPLQLTTQTMTVNAHSNFSHVNKSSGSSVNNFDIKSHSNSLSNETCYNQIVPSCPPEVQDANIQTSPIMSEDDNSNDQDDTALDSDDKTNESSSDEQPKLVIAMDAIKSDEPKVTEDVDEASNSPATATTTVPESDAINSSSASAATSMPVIKQQQIESPEEIATAPQIVDSGEKKEPVDLSGLQLLSNSIDVFHKANNNNNNVVKLEPTEVRKVEVTVASSNMPMTSIITPILEKPTAVERATPQQQQQHIPEDLGGLTLLCALAEQRLEEDFHNQDDNTPLVSESNAANTTGSSECGGNVKKKKHKMKTSKKSKHKEERKAKKRKHSSSAAGAEKDDDFKGEMAESLKRVKTKFDLPVSSVNDVFSLMEDDMKTKLASITRQLEEKKRELKQITIDPAEKSCASPMSTSSTVSEPAVKIKTPKMSYLGSPAAPLKFSIVPAAAMSPSFSSSSNSESIVDIPKLSMSDTSDSGSKDDAETKRIKRAQMMDSEEPGCSGEKSSAKSASFMFSSKYNLATASPTLGSWTSSISKNGKASLPFVKQEEYGGLIKESAFKDNRVFAIFGEGYQQKFQPSTPLTLSLSSRATQQPQPSTSSSTKVHSKHKKHNKERRRHKEKKRPDSRCSITLEHLKMQKARVLMSQGGLFYAGSLTPVESNEIFAIQLDGERGNRPHIMSQEEILKQAILEVQPKSVSECPPGTRLCAYWSQQYRCLYPGVATSPGSPDVDGEGKYVDVEFDDGDNGRILLDHVRFLPADYAIFEYDPNPLQSMNKRKRPLIDGQKPSPENPLSREERKKMKKMRKDKTRLIQSHSMSGDDAQDSHSVSKSFEKKHKKKHKCRDDVCGHRKHKKRRKHKKHHHRSLDEEDRELQNHVQNAMSISNDSNNNEEEFEEDDSMSNDDSVTQYEIVKRVDADLSIKEDHESNTMESSLTESSGSLYNPKKSTAHCSSDKDKLNKSNESGSKMAAFLPARQLWAWCDKGTKRATGRVKKQFHKSIQRGKEVITIGDSAVFLSTGRPDRPYIGKIESLWETANGGMVVRVKWFYHPEETQGCPNLKFPGALFESPHEDENDIQTISHKCEVLDHASYVKKFGSKPKNYESIYENNDTYYLAGHYDPTLYHLKMQPEIPSLPKNQKWTA